MTLACSCRRSTRARTLSQLSVFYASHLPQYLIAVVERFPGDSWVVRFQLVEEGGAPLPKGETPLLRYSYAFMNAFLQIFAITEGVIAPVRPIEVWLVMAAMFIGVLTQAVLVASLTAVISSLDASGRDYQQSMDMLNQYMRHARLPRELRAKLRHFYELLYPGGRSFDEERILGKLSRSLLEEVTQHMCQPVLQALSVVEGTEPGLAGALSKELHRTVYVMGDYIIREGEPASTMYFIEHGEVEVCVGLSQEEHFRPSACLTSNAFSGRLSRRFSQVRNWMETAAARLLRSGLERSLARCRFSRRRGAPSRRSA